MKTAGLHTEAVRRLLTAVLFLVGVFAAGPGHQLVHLAQGHGDRAHAHACCGAEASPSQSAAEEGVEPLSADPHDHVAHAGCVLCNLSLDLPGGGAPDPAIGLGAVPVPERPTELLLGVAVDRSKSKRGPPHRV